MVSDSVKFSDGLAAVNYAQWSANTTGKRFAVVVASALCMLYVCPVNHVENEKILEIVSPVNEQ